MTRKQSPNRIVGTGPASGAWTIGPAVASGNHAVPLYTSIGNWPTWFYPEPEPSMTPVTAYGVLERIRWDNADQSFERTRNRKAAGILMHALTWHAITLLDDPDVKPEGYLFGMVVKTTWDMPEWEWVYAYRGKKLTTRKATDIRNAKQAKSAYKELRSMFDGKAASIQAKRR